MSGKHGGVQALIKHEVPRIQYFSHQIHLVVVHVCDGSPVVRGYFDIWNLLSKFLSTSKVSVIYKKFGNDAMARLMHQKWSCHYKPPSLVKNVAEVRTTLDCFISSETIDAEISIKGARLLAAISNPQFIFADEVMNLILNLLAPADKI